MNLFLFKIKELFIVYYIYTSITNFDVLFSIFEIFLKPLLHLSLVRIDAPTFLLNRAYFRETFCRYIIKYG